MGFWDTIGDLAKEALSEGAELIELEQEYKRMDSYELKIIVLRGSATEKAVALKVLNDRGEI